MAWAFSQRYWRVVLVSMLALLHIAVFRGVADPWARAAAGASRSAAAVAAIPARRAARLARPGRDPGAGCLRGDAAARLVVPRLLGGGARRPGRRQGLPAARTLAAALLPRGARLPARAPRHRHPAGDRAPTGNPGRRARLCRVRAAPGVRAHRSFSLGAGFRRRAAHHRLLLQRVRHAGDRRGDPRQLHLHERDAHAVSRGADRHHLRHRRRHAARRAGVESAQRRRHRRVFSATCSRSACRWRSGCTCSPSCAGRSTARPLPERGWSPLRCAAVGGRGALARRGARDEQGSARPMGSTTLRASSRSPSFRAIASGRRCAGTCTCSASCWGSSTSPSCARRSCARRATCRRCTRPARA